MKCGGFSNEMFVFSFQTFCFVISLLRKKCKKLSLPFYVKGVPTTLNM